MIDRRNRPAFTLIELLVVISVIALLIGITLPALGNARETSKRAKCLANLRGLGQGFSLYLNESKGLFPLVRPLHNTGGTPPPGGGNDVSLLDLLPQYLDVDPPRKEEGTEFYIVADVFKCPSDRVSDADNQAWEPAWRTEGTSYEYVPGVLMLAAELLFNVRSPQIGVTKAYEKNVDRGAIPILQDFGDWHKLRRTGPPKNAVYFNDFHADWAPPPDDTAAGRMLQDARLYGG